VAVRVALATAAAAALATAATFAGAAVLSAEGVVAQPEIAMASALSANAATGPRTSRRVGVDMADLWGRISGKESTARYAVNPK
jgi:hypothetical protein